MHHERSLTDSARACTFSRVSGPDIRLLRAALLSWYDRAKRRLPWREHAHDPYAVWVSEVMLQQTRVDTVLPYYQRFLSRFPSLEALALAMVETNDPDAPTVTLDLRGTAPFPPLPDMGIVDNGVTPDGALVEPRAAPTPDGQPGAVS